MKNILSATALICVLFLACTKNEKKDPNAKKCYRCEYTANGNPGYIDTCVEGWQSAPNIPNCHPL